MTHLHVVRDNAASQPAGPFRAEEFAKRQAARKQKAHSQRMAAMARQKYNAELRQRCQRKREKHIQHMRDEYNNRRNG